MGTLFNFDLKKNVESLIEFTLPEKFRHNGKNYIT